MCNDGHAHHFKCAAGLLFNSQFNYCGWPKDVICDLDAARKKAKEALKKPESQQQIPQQPVQQNPPPVYKTPAENQNAFQFKPQKPQQPVQQTQQVQPQQVQQQPQTRRQPNTAPQPPQNNVRPPQQASQPNNAMGSAASNDPWNWSPFQQQQQNPVGLPFYWSCEYLKGVHIGISYIMRDYLDYVFIAYSINIFGMHLCLKWHTVLTLPIILKTENSILNCYKMN